MNFFQILLYIKVTLLQLLFLETVTFLTLFFALLFLIDSNCHFLKIISH